MTPSDMLIAELLAMRAVCAALSREILLRVGSDSFVHLEAQAKQFAIPADGKVHPDVLRHAQRIISDIFLMADGTSSPT